MNVIRCGWLMLALCCSFSPLPAEEGLVNQKVRVELRWAEAKAVDGLTDETAVELSCTPDKVYLHQKPLLTNADLTKATRRLANAAADRYFVEVNLTKEGGKRLAATCIPNKGKPLVVLIDGKVAAAMVVQGQLTDFVPITGLFTKDEAQRIINAINKK